LRVLIAFRRRAGRRKKVFQFFYFLHFTFVDNQNFYSMSILQIPILFIGSKGEKRLNTLFDSGADLSCIHPDCVKDLETPVHMDRIRHVKTANTGHLLEV
jgi:hypothetical protein